MYVSSGPFLSFEIEIGDGPEIGYGPGPELDNSNFIFYRKMFLLNLRVE